MDRKKRSLGRDVFGETRRKPKSQTVRRMLEKKAPPKPAEAKEVSVTVRLTPSNIKHLDALIKTLEKNGKGKFSRNELIRVAIALLSAGDL